MIWIRPLVFAVLFASLLVVEGLNPKRSQKQGLSSRRVTNSWLFVAGIAVVQLLEPLAAIAASTFASRQQFGLMSTLNWHPVVEILVCIVLLDAAIYLQHLATHKIPFLWSLHRVHHVDSDVDVTTALRFHPLEILLSMFYKSLWVIILGAPLLAVLIFEMLLNGFAMFNHANLRLSQRLDRILRLGIVTPDMHIVHHSQIRDDSDSNYGFCLSCWDRFFGTYSSRPLNGYDNLRLGQSDCSVEKASSVVDMLLSPFKR